MGLFDKKTCDICGEKIGLLGNRKLTDGNCCKKCASRLSFWFDERRHSTVAQIKDQLAYREANRQDVSRFRATRTFGEGTLIRIDDSQKKFMVARPGEDNPDVIEIAQVTGCSLDVKEHRHELKQTNAQGQEVSFNPPRYEYEYDFYMVINVNSPWFDTIRFKLNRSDLVLQDLAVSRGGFMHTAFDPRRSPEYQQYEAMSNEIIQALTPASFGYQQGTAGYGHAMPNAQSYPYHNTWQQNTNPQPASQTWFCTNCGQSNQGTSRFCENCGTPRQ